MTISSTSFRLAFRVPLNLVPANCPPGLLSTKKFDAPLATLFEHPCPGLGQAGLPPSVPDQGEIM